MKEKVLYLIIGILLGAMVATGIFMIIDRNNDNNNAGNNPEDFMHRGNFVEFDINNLPEGFELPEGFDPENMPQRGGPGGGQRRIIQNGQEVDPNSI